MSLKEWITDVTTPAKKSLYQTLKISELRNPKRSVAIISKSDIKDLELDENTREVELPCEDYTFKGSLDVRRNGYGTFTSNINPGLTLTGNIKEGCLNGLIVEREHEQKRKEVNYRNGRKHGYFRIFRWDNVFMGLGTYANDRQRLPFLERCSGESYLIQSSEEDFIYLYPTLEHCIVGKWLKGSLIHGVYGRVESFTLQNGVPVPFLSSDGSCNVGSFDPSTRNRISSNPLIMDPFDKESVYVGSSIIGECAGEGLFAKQKLPSGSLVCLFNGLRIAKDGLCKRIKPGDSDWSDYRLTLDKSTDLDIPQDCVSLENYSATLGHKACHSFENKNARFDNLYHPRFGEIMSIVATREIAPGEEIFVNYNYDLAYSPDWYLDLWKDFIH